jgi:murein DD-endopeptidase MepM/ murein hydrolase activator NlpD
MKYGTRVVLVVAAVFASVMANGPLPNGAMAGALGLTAGAWSKPVTGVVVRSFDPPATRFGPGHVGVDFAAAPGTPVRAAGDGIVVFAARIGSQLHVVVRHDGDLRTSYSFLASIDVVNGQRVDRGAIVGTSGGTGPGHAATVVHFGLRLGASYVDPMALFAPVDLAAVVHLAAPRYGASARADDDLAPVGERSAIVAALRVDSRPALAPPEWWGKEPVREPARPTVAAASAPRIGRTVPRRCRLHCTPAR